MASTVRGPLSRAVITAVSYTHLDVYKRQALSRVEDPFGRRLTFTYDGQGLLSELTDPAGNKITYTYDAAGNLLTVTYPDHSTRS